MRVPHADAEKQDKGTALLQFLKDAATLRRKRIAAYGTTDSILWLAHVPKDRNECRSPFLAESPGETPDFWLEVRKTRRPRRPAVPEVIAQWVRAEDLDRADTEPELLSEITILIEKHVPDPESPPSHPQTIVQKVPETRRLRDHPEIEEAYLEYLVEQWEPWAKEMRQWQQAHEVYEDVDLMRRRLEEFEERYELVLGVGLLLWRDSLGITVKRHLLTAPAEIELDAARGILTVVPAASFEGFTLQLDMLESQDRPRLERSSLEQELEELDIEAWDKAKVAAILQEIANRASPRAEVDDDILPPTSVDEVFRVVFAPALVLRERSPTAFEEVVAGLMKHTNDENPVDVTTPWATFISEGDEPRDVVPREQFSGETYGDPSERVLFPLPTNAEQRRIVERLRRCPSVVVKGPPGTGKSLTIANLICHLLASGERVLVTAQSPKALDVLRLLLPNEQRDLCVTALGSSREDQRLLEEGVRGILRRQNEWRGTEWSKARIDNLEQELAQLEGERAELQRKLRESREAEMHSHTLPGGYEGTAARIAKRVAEERESFEWIPDVPDERTPFPLQPEELRLLAEVNETLSDEKLAEVRLDIGKCSLPDPDDFRKIVAVLDAAKKEEARAREIADSRKYDRLRNLPRGTLEKFQLLLEKLDENVVRIERGLGDVTSEAIKDLLADSGERWRSLSHDVVSLLKKTETNARGAIGEAILDVPPDIEHERLLMDAERRLAHFRSGRRRGFWVFAPRTVRETRYIEKRCLVNSVPPRSADSLAKIVCLLQLESAMGEFRRLWPAPFPGEDEPQKAFRVAMSASNALVALLTFFRDFSADLSGYLTASERVELADHAERHAWLAAATAAMARHRTHDAKKPLAECFHVIHGCLDTGRAHPYMDRLKAVAEQHDSEGWQRAWQVRERLRVEKERMERYELLLATLDQHCPGLERFLRSTQGNPDWKDRILRLDRAWAWACARKWLQRVLDESAYQDLVASAHRCNSKIEKKTGELAAEKAWHAFFQRLDSATCQSLKAWVKAVERIGKGTGKYAFRHRRTARRYLMACIPKMPAWVMPLHKVWDTIEATPGLFDTVIVDESSQAGIDALVLLLLAKRIIVVGDDKQNSPEAVGVPEDDIARVAREHMNNFRFRDEFRPDTSLFDHAERTFGNLISLREHFRCVPEIIRFSNDLCYSDAPLIPLRQAPPNRLTPLRHTFVPTGMCDGTGQRIVNHAEAQAIVETICQCVQDEAYDGKTMGVIVLQGRAQGELIGRLLAEALEPNIIQERKIRCGVPATFQGDERDVIVLSLVMAPNVPSRALSRLPDQRRFNVAMSRARDQAWLFHSIEQHDVSPQCLRRRLLRFFQSTGRRVTDGLVEERERLEREAYKTKRVPGGQPEPYESWFEVDVALELLRRNYQMRPQYEIAGKRIDLVVEGEDVRLAVECDGDAWHGPDRYEQDMARQRQLERAGWTFVRVRESEFYADRNAAVARVLDVCGELGIRPVGHEGEIPRPQSDVGEGKEDIVPTDIGASAGENVDEDAETAEEVQDASGNPDVGPFSGYSPALEFPDPRNASLANVKGALKQIIERDGPLTRASIHRLYIEGCPYMQRGGRVVRQAINRALGSMLGSGEIEQQDEFGNGSPEGQVLRLAGTPRVRERPAGRRDLLEIPPSELLLVVSRLDPSATMAHDVDTLCRKVIEHYGYSRLTSVRRRHLVRVFSVRDRATS